MRTLCETTVIICGIVRNAERGLTRNIPVMNEFCRRLKDYRIFIYENDSKDRTKEILQEWQRQDEERIHISINDTDASVSKTYSEDCLGKSEEETVITEKR